MIAGRLIRPLLLMAALASHVFSLVLSPAQAAGPIDMLLVIDNSGSMKKHDPQFLLREAVSAFLDDVEEGTRVGVMIFDAKVDFAVPFTPVGPDTRPRFMQSLDRVTYLGQFTNSPAAVERAIYELKNNARPQARRLAVFMTDGIVDTGDVARDRENSRWMREELAEEAAAHGIQIFGVAFTDNADFQTIQSLALKTDADYFRAYDAAELSEVFQRVKDAVFVPGPEPVPSIAIAAVESPASSGEAASPSATTSPLIVLESVPTSDTVSPVLTKSALSARALATSGVEAQASAEPEMSDSEAQQDVAGSSDGRPAEPQTSADASRELMPSEGETSLAGSVPQAGSDDSIVPREKDDPPFLATVPEMLVLAGLGSLTVLCIIVLERRRRPAKPVTPAPVLTKSRRPSASLIDVARAGGGGDRISIDADVVIVGRQAAAVSGVQSLIVQRATVGRQHAILEFKRFQFWVTDQNSTNGTFVNGERVVGERLVVHGDRLRFHDVEFVLEVAELVDTDRTAYASPHLRQEHSTAPSPGPLAAPAGGVPGSDSSSGEQSGARGAAAQGEPVDLLATLVSDLEHLDFGAPTTPQFAQLVSAEDAGASQAKDACREPTLTPSTAAPDEVSLPEREEEFEDSTELNPNRTTGCINHNGAIHNTASGEPMADDSGGALVDDERTCFNPKG